MNDAGVLDEFVANEQFAEMDAMSETTVLLSDTTWKVEFVVFEENAAWVSAPPGRLELLGSPYCFIGLSHDIGSVCGDMSTTDLVGVKVRCAVAKSTSPYERPVHEREVAVRNAQSSGPRVAATIYPR